MGRSEREQKRARGRREKDEIRTGDVKEGNKENRMSVTLRHEEISNQQVVAFNEVTKHKRGRRKGEMVRELSK